VVCDVKQRCVYALRGWRATHTFPFMAAHFLLFYALPQSELVPFGNNLRVASDAAQRSQSVRGAIIAGIQAPNDFQPGEI
jgi:hypothetical protein